MRVLILGVSGFTGRHLARYGLQKKGVELYGVDRYPSAPVHDETLKKVHFFKCDLFKQEQIESVLKRIRPEKIFHLAGQASVIAAWKDPLEAFHANVATTQNLFDAIRKTGVHPLVHVACSSDQYGKCPSSHMPIKETEPFRPVTPYAVSKIAQEFLTYQQFAAFGIRVIRTRAFNHVGPGQTEHFVAASFARQVALIEKGAQPNILKVGNVSSIRDFVDVRDVVRAYWLALEYGRPGEVYNICSGIGRPVSDLLKILVGKSRKPIIIQRDQAKVRASDIPKFVGCPDKFKRLTGWKPLIPLDQSMEDLLDDWRSNVDG